MKLVVDCFHDYPWRCQAPDRCSRGGFSGGICVSLIDCSLGVLGQSHWGEPGMDAARQNPVCHLLVVKPLKSAPPSPPLRRSLIIDILVKLVALENSLTGGLQGWAC